MRYLILLSLLAASPAAAKKNAELAVLPLGSHTLESSTRAVLDELLVTLVHESSPYAVISAADINAVLGLDKMKDVAGCGDVSCAADIAGALGVRYVLATSADVLGDQLVLTATLIDTADTVVLGRNRNEESNDPNRYLGAMRTLVGKVFGGEAGGPAAAGATASKDEAGRALGAVFLLHFSEAVSEQCLVDTANGSSAWECTAERSLYGLAAEYRIPHASLLALTLR